MIGWIAFGILVLLSISLIYKGQVDGGSHTLNTNIARYICAAAIVAAILSTARGGQPPMPTQSDMTTGTIYVTSGTRQVRASEWVEAVFPKHTSGTVTTGTVTR